MFDFIVALIDSEDEPNMTLIFLLTSFHPLLCSRLCSQDMVMRGSFTALVAVALLAIAAAPLAQATEMSTAVAVQGVTNPWYAFRGTASFSFALGYEISVRTASDGKYWYGRGW